MNVAVGVADSEDGVPRRQGLGPHTTAVVLAWSQPPCSERGTEKPSETTEGGINSRATEGGINSSQRMCYYNPKMFSCIRNDIITFIRITLLIHNVPRKFMLREGN